MNEMPTKCLSLENGNFLSEDEIEAFELSNPDIVEMTAWRIRKHLWGCVFGCFLKLSEKMLVIYNLNLSRFSTSDFFRYAHFLSYVITMTHESSRKR